MNNANYIFEKRTLKIWRGLRRRTEYDWTCYTVLFGERLILFRSSETYRNKEDRDAVLKHIIEGIKADRYEILEKVEKYI